MVRVQMLVFNYPLTMAALRFPPPTRSPLLSRVASLSLRESLPHCDVWDLSGQLQRVDGTSIESGSFGSVYIYEAKPNSLLSRAQSAHIQFYAVKGVRFSEENIERDNLQRIKQVSCLITGLRPTHADHA